jgi:hypothetical protein
MNWKGRGRKRSWPIWRCYPNIRLGGGEYVKPRTNLTHLGSEVLAAVVMNNFIFAHITSCSPLKINRNFEGTCCHHLHGRRISQARYKHEVLLATFFMLVSCLAYFWTLKMEATCSCETSLDFQRTTQSYILEDKMLCSGNTDVRHICEEIRS